MQEPPCTRGCCLHVGNSCWFSMCLLRTTSFLSTNVVHQPDHHDRQDKRISRVVPFLTYGDGFGAKRADTARHVHLVDVWIHAKSKVLHVFRKSHLVARVFSTSLHILLRSQMYLWHRIRISPQPWRTCRVFGGRFLVLNELCGPREHLSCHGKF